MMKTIRPRLGLSLIGLLIQGFACTHTIGSTPSSEIVAVDAHEEWQNTGISLIRGDEVVIEYVEGRWTNWLDELPFFGPDGGPSYVCSSSSCVEPLRGYAQGSLIGRIGNSDPFAVGEYMEFTADNEGMLQLRMNDVGAYDNKGSVLMEISLDQSVECGLWLDVGGMNPGLAVDFSAGCA